MLPVVRREPAEAQVAGVCAALARAWGVDATLVRVAFVLAAVITNGFALAAYLIGWALIPTTGHFVEPIRHLLPFTRTWTRGTLVALVVTFVVGGMLVTGAGPGALGVMGIAWLVLRFGRPRHHPVPPPRHSTPRTEFERLGQAWTQRLENVDAGRPPGWEPTHVTLLDHAALHARPASRTDPGVSAASRRAALRTWLGVFAGGALMWAALVTELGAGRAVPPVAWAAAALAVSSVALILVARPGRAAFGRPRGLLPLTVITSLLTLGLMAPAPPLAVVDVGPQSHSFTAADLTGRHVLAFGEQTVDLSGVTVSTDRTVRFTQDLGSVTVRMPEEGNVVVHATADAGEVTAPGVSDEGLDVELTWERIADPDAPVLTVHVEVGLGEVEVVT